MSIFSFLKNEKKNLRNTSYDHNLVLILWSLCHRLQCHFYRHTNTFQLTDDIEEASNGHQLHKLVERHRVQESPYRLF